MAENYGYYGVYRERYSYYPQYGYPYDAGSYTRIFDGWHVPRLDGKGEILHLQKIRDRSRDLFRNDTIGSAAINRLVRSALGKGLKMNPAIDSETLKISDKQTDQWEKQTQNLWDEWAESPELCDERETMDFYELQDLAAYTHLIGGDCFFLLPIRRKKNGERELGINIIDPERVDTPIDMVEDNRVYYGVETNTYGAVRAYYVADINPHSIFVNFNKNKNRYHFKRIPKYGTRSGRLLVGHFFTGTRPDQTRGVPFLAPVITKIKQLGRFTNAEIAGAVISSYVVASITRGSNQPISTENDQRREGLFEMNEALVFETNDDSEWHVHESPKPNANFDVFVNAITKQIGASLGIPYEVLFSAFNSNYSASRGALLEAWRFFRFYRDKFNRRFNNVVYKEWLTSMVLAGKIKAKGFFDDPLKKRAWLENEWTGVGMGHIDPLKEAKAVQARLDAKVSTRKRESQELTGIDFKKTAKILNKEKEMLPKEEEEKTFNAEKEINEMKEEKEMESENEKE